MVNIKDIAKFGDLGEFIKLSDYALGAILQVNIKFSVNKKQNILILWQK